MSVLCVCVFFFNECAVCDVVVNSDFGDLSKRLADAWKQLPEGDKQVPNIIITP